MQYLYSSGPVDHSLSQERVDAFKTFVSANCRTTLNPETVRTELDAWFGLLSPRRSMTRIEQMRIKNATTGLVFLRTGWAFHALKIQQKRTVYNQGMRIETCSRPAAQSVDESQFFDTLICAFKQIMGESTFTRNGIDTVHGFGWIVVNGQIYPYHYKDQCRTMHWPMPYGPFVEGKQVSITCIQGKLVEIPGFFMCWPTSEDNTFRLVMTNGAPNFTTAPTTIRLRWDHPFVEKYTKGLQSKSSQKAYQETSENGVFLPLPRFNDPTDDVLFHGALFEAIKDLHIPITTSHVVELDEGAAATPVSPLVPDLSPDRPDVQIPVSTESTQEESAFGSNPFYQQLVEQEWERRQAAVVKQVRSVAGDQKEKPKGKGNRQSIKKQTDDPQNAPEALQSLPELVRDPAVRKIWEGRVKFAEVARLVAYQIQESGAQVSIRTKGSHVKLHIETDSQRSGITVVRPHGASSGEMSANSANSLMEQINALLILPPRHR